MKRTIRLTEADLHNMISEAVKTALNEIGDTPDGQFALGQVAGRAKFRGDKEMYKRADDEARSHYSGDYKSTYRTGLDNQFDYETYKDDKRLDNLKQNKKYYRDKTLKDRKNRWSL